MVLKASTIEEVVEGLSKFFDLPKSNPALLVAALKEMEMEKVKKDLEIQEMKSELIRENSRKDLELSRKDMELQLQEVKNENKLKQMEIKHEKDLQVVMMTQKMTYLEKVLLESKQTATARGIFEYYLRECKAELKSPGNFNAKVVCSDLQSAGNFSIVIVRNKSAS